MVKLIKLFIIFRTNINIILFGIYLCLFVACFFPQTTGFSDQLILPKWYLAITVVTILLMVEACLIYIKNTFPSEICNKIPQKHKGELFALALSIVTTFESIYVIMSSFFYNNITYTTILGTFDNPSGMSLHLCLGIPFIYYSAKICHKKFWRKFLYLSICLVVLAICLSRSRTGLICLTGFLSAILCTQNKIHKWVKLVLIIILILGTTVWVLTYKQDSSNGRLFILERSWELIQKKPWTGFGIGGFEREYMWIQEQYFAIHTNSEYAWLADEIRHPLNEFIYVWVNFGIAAPCIMLLSFVGLIYWLVKQKNFLTDTIIYALISLFIFSCFSYPFRYPLPWIIIAFAFTCIKEINNIYFRLKNLTAFLLLLISLYIGSQIAIAWYYERKWSYTATCASLGGSKRMMSEYKLLYKHYAKNPYFLYNYAVEQLYAGYFTSALHTAKKCSNYWASYNLQLLKGDICYYLKQYNEAIHYYQTANNMCPVRFAPLEGLYRIYKACNEPDKADSISTIIHNKKIKILSPEIIKIKKNIMEKSDHAVMVDEKIK